MELIDYEKIKNIENDNTQASPFENGSEITQSHDNKLEKIPADFYIRKYGGSQFYRQIVFKSGTQFTYKIVTLCKNDVKIVENTIKIPICLEKCGIKLELNDIEYKLQKNRDYYFPININFVWDQKYLQYAIKTAKDYNYSEYKTIIENKIFEKENQDIYENQLNCNDTKPNEEQTGRNKNNSGIKSQMQYQDQNENQLNCNDTKPNEEKTGQNNYNYGIKSQIQYQDKNENQLNCNDARINEEKTGQNKYNFGIKSQIQYQDQNENQLNCNDARINEEKTGQNKYNFGIKSQIQNQDPNENQLKKNRYKIQIYIQNKSGKKKLIAEFKKGLNFPQKQNASLECRDLKIQANCAYISLILIKDSGQEFELPEIVCDLSKDKNSQKNHTQDDFKIEFEFELTANSFNYRYKSNTKAMWSKYHFTDEEKNELDKFCCS